jgi:DNA-binding NtrC family response regulator
MTDVGESDALTAPRPAAARILIVDDEPLKRITLQIELSEAGYDVADAADATAAMALFDAQPADIVVTDVRMNGPSGLDLLSYVKDRRPETVVVLMTAYGTVETAVLAMKRGAADYITKPFTTDELLDKLRRLNVGPKEGAPGEAAVEALHAPALELPQLSGAGLSETLADIEKRVILMALRQCGGNQARAAQRLGIPRTTLRDKMARYSIPVT